MKYQAYSSYKDSGVEWLGVVPEHWQVKRLRFIATYKNSNVDKKSYEGQSSVRLCNYVDIYCNEFIKNDMNFMIATASKAEIETMKLSYGDVIITKDSEDSNDIGIPAIVSENLDNVVCGYHLTVISSGNIDTNRFIHRVIQSDKTKFYLFIMSLGITRFGLGQNTIANIQIPLPPTTQEQTAIANFLDRETSHIDELSKEKQRFIELLKEKRQALISHAVTKGLNPTVKMKNSGIAWLGEIPEHWIKTPIKYVLKGIIDTEHKTVTFFDEGEYLVVRTTNIKNGKLLIDGAKYTDYTGYIEWTKRGKPQSGDIMFTREAPAGEACLVPEDINLCMGQRTVLMKVNHKLLESNYGLFSIYGGLAAEFIQALSQGTTVIHFNMSDINNIPILLPPIEEQNQIANYLNQQTQKIDALITETQNSINLLKEHRAALISAAVTGKIDISS
ncbi:MAG: restriction endonuclease subunit S [Methylococcales bacterium]